MVQAYLILMNNHLQFQCSWIANSSATTQKAVLKNVTSSYRGRGQLKCDGTRAETRFRLSAKRTSPFQSAGRRQFSRLLAAEVCASVVVMLDTPCSEVVWRVLATHCIRQFPLHFPSRASTCAITFRPVYRKQYGLCWTCNKPDLPCENRAIW